MDYTLTRPNVDAQLAAIRARAQALTHGADERAFNWQPRGGRAWSVAQCLHHLALTSDLYGQALDEAMSQAGPRQGHAPMRPNLLGRWLIWVIEPPNYVKVPARADLMPASSHTVDMVVRQYHESLDRLSQLTDRALTVDSQRARYANPLASGVRSFNVVTGLMVMLAHNRRHLLQAERVKAQYLQAPASAPTPPAR